MKSFNKGIISSSLGSFWWGVLGTYYFQYISFIGTLEVVVHRCIWTTLILFFTTFIFGKWSIFKKVLSDKKNSFNFIYNKYFNFWKLVNMDLCSIYK